jgi:hypothetical protein
MLSREGTLNLLNDFSTCRRHCSRTPTRAGRLAVFRLGLLNYFVRTSG